MNKEHILCVLLNDHEVEDTFTQWPLHVTLVPWFSPAGIQKFIKDAEAISSSYSYINSTVGEQRIWGPNTVNVIERVSKLHDLHNELLGLVKSHGKLLINEQYTGKYYTPHVTHQHGKHLESGDNVKLSAIYLVEKTDGIREKKIIAKLGLSAE